MFEFFATLGLSGLGSLLRALIIFLICFIAIKIVMTIVGRLLGRSQKLDGTLKGFVTTACKVVLWVLAIIIVAESLGIDTASLVAAVSVVGLALSLAVQNVAANLFSGLTLLMTRPFGEGDFIEVGGSTGTVRSVGLFYTVIDTVDNRVISIPNGDVTAAAITNFSRESMRRVDWTFNVSYENKTETVKAALMEAISMDERICSQPEAPFVVIGAYKESTIEFFVRVWCKNDDYWDVYFGMNERVRECFEHHGVKLSYSHMNVHIVEK